MVSSRAARLSVLAACIATAGVALCAQADRQGAPAVSSERIRGHLEFLADDRLEGRGTGTAGFQRAADYVAAAFLSLRLEPAFGRSFFQPVAVRHADVIASDTSLVVRRDGRERRLMFGTDFVSSGDVHRTAVSVDAPVVFVGDGVSAPSIGRDDYAGIDARGKIAALVLRAMPGSLQLNPSTSGISTGALRRRSHTKLWGS